MGHSGVDLRAFPLPHGASIRRPDLAESVEAHQRALVESRALQRRPPRCARQRFHPLLFYHAAPRKTAPPDSFPRRERKDVARRDALARERKWVGLLNSMWPHGFNAAYPGFPVSRKVLQRRHDLPRPDPAPTTHGDPPASPDLAKWLERCHRGDSSALAEARTWSKAQLCSTLDWLQGHVPTDQRRSGHLSLECKLVELVKARRKEAPARHFLKFCYSNNGARFLDLRKVLREEAIYKLHPNPDVGAAIMVCDKFAPQWQAWICNYARVSEDLDVESARADSLAGCTCHEALRRRESSAFHDGHVVSNESDLLRWPFLQTLAAKGKKYRLEGPPDAVLHDLRHALNQYVTWLSACNPNDLGLRRKLELWADAVEAQCSANWQRAASREDLVPTGFPGLSHQIREAQKSLVFLHDDRAPHGLMFVCKRWYQKQMATYLADTEVFEDVAGSWEDVVAGLRDINQRLHFPTGAGVVYNYGIWKPAKRKFRFIAGTRKSRDSGHTRPDVRPAPVAAAAAEKPEKAKEPPRQPFYALNKALVQLLKHVESALKEKDELRQQREGLKAFWGIDSVESFVRMVRTHSKDILAGGLETADFTTMYTAFTFDAIIERTMLSATEAWGFARDTLVPIGVDASVEPRLTTEGWRWDDMGYSISELREMVTVAVCNNYTCNGGRVRKQIRGMPMGLPPAPQLANLACYPVERDHMYRLPPQLRSTAVMRYIDDIVHPATMPLPTADEYGMEYKVTGSGESVVCLGVRVYIQEQPDGPSVVHTTVHDREAEYPHHIVRYPLGSTTAPYEQLGGVIMGRLEFARMACSHMSDFKHSVANVFRNAMWRGYSRHLVQSVWSRFLFQRWHAADIRVRELRTWFSKVWKWLQSGSNRAPPAPWEKAAPLDPELATQAPDFLRVFGHQGPATWGGIDALLEECTPPAAASAQAEPLSQRSSSSDRDVEEVDRATSIRFGKQHAQPESRFDTPPPPPPLGTHSPEQGREGATSPQFCDFLRVHHEHSPDQGQASVCLFVPAPLPPPSGPSTADPILPGTLANPHPGDVQGARVFFRLAGGRKGSRPACLHAGGRPSDCGPTQAGLSGFGHHFFCNPSRSCSRDVHSGGHRVPRGSTHAPQRHLHRHCPRGHGHRRDGPAVLALRRPTRRPHRSLIGTGRRQRPTRSPLPPRGHTRATRRVTPAGLRRSAHGAHHRAVHPRAVPGRSAHSLRSAGALRGAHTRVRTHPPTRPHVGAKRDGSVGRHA